MDPDVHIDVPAITKDDSSSTGDTPDTAEKACSTEGKNDHNDAEQFADPNNCNSEECVSAPGDPACLSSDDEKDKDLIEERKAHIAKIRFEKGLDSDSEENEMSHNVADLKAALEVLSDKLYSKPTHFLLEFIQNADDNEYAAGISPTISFTEADGALHIKCNEKGFQAKNVEAICRIAQSTKKDRSKGFIGEKGVGFKSVFKIADVVWISSNQYSFRFDRNGPLGMIAPIWSSFPTTVEKDQTQFWLQLSPQKKR